MFQTFDEVAQPQDAPPRIKRIRAQMVRLDIEALLIPRADAHQGEYVPASAERLKWATGFTGSAGMAIITRRHAALFTDGRYTLQAAAQLDKATFEIIDSVTTEWASWLAKKLAAGASVGFDPWLHTADAIAAAKAATRAKGIAFKPLARNVVDLAWGAERPAEPAMALAVQPLAFAGVAAEHKIAALQKTLREEGQDGVVLTLPDSICWLLNIRGSDVAHNPVALAFAIVPATGKPDLFIDHAKLEGEALRHVSQLTRLNPPKALPAALAALRRSGQKIRLDAATAAEWFFLKLGKSAVKGSDPCILPKARKNEAELAGMRAAHKRDGAAVCRFLAWLDREAGGGRVDEITAVTKLENCRAETQQLKEISFPTISGAGPNGAIVHYRVSTATNRRLKSGELFLVDSGAQYQDGTTDITRTVAIGKPTREMCERFTLVLKGHIALATARFPKGTRGVQLDTLARHALWQQGLDYDHGTGHGVGCYLSVHEGPQSISKRGMAVLEPGMVVSNEPGYYKAGAYGIRIENLEVVTAATVVEGGEREMLGFEALTLVPMDRRLVVVSMLSEAERTWLNSYHQRVRREISPELSGADRTWLEAATERL